MKIYLKPYLFLVLLSSFSLCPKAQVESAIELMNDTASWANTDAHIGGAEEEEVDDNPLFNEKAIDLGLWSIADSVANIPAFDTYCNWDTRNLFHVKSAKENIDEVAHFILCHEACDFVYPVQGQITSPFGPRWGRMHYGLDIDLETGDPVSSAFEGMVRISQFHASYGNVIVIRHNNGLETVYAHLSQRRVVPGDHVEAGDLIGLGGNTGRSFGSHLHFEIRYMGDAIDPNVVVDPIHKKLRDWEVSLTDKHFEYSSLISASASNSGGQKKYHTVRSGETLSAIARKRGTSISALCKLNKLKKTSTIRPGQKLRIR